MKLNKAIDTKSVHERTSLDMASSSVQENTANVQEGSDVQVSKTQVQLGSAFNVIQATLDKWSSLGLAAEGWLVNLESKDRRSTRYMLTRDNGRNGQIRISLELVDASYESAPNNKYLNADWNPTKSLTSQNVMHPVDWESIDAGGIEFDWLPGSAMAFPFLVLQKCFLLIGEKAAFNALSDRMRKTSIQWSGLHIVFYSEAHTDMSLALAALKALVSYQHDVGLGLKQVGGRWVTESESICARLGFTAKTYVEKLDGRGREGKDLSFVTGITLTSRNGFSVTFYDKSAEVKFNRKRPNNELNTSLVNSKTDDVSNKIRIEVKISARALHEKNGLATMREVFGLVGGIDPGTGRRLAGKNAAEYSEIKKVDFLQKSVVSVTDWKDMQVRLVAMALDNLNMTYLVNPRPYKLLKEQALDLIRTKYTENENLAEAIGGVLNEWKSLGSSTVSSKRALFERLAAEHSVTRENIYSAMDYVKDNLELDVTLFSYDNFNTIWTVFKDSCLSSVDFKKKKALQSLVDEDITLSELDATARGLRLLNKKATKRALEVRLISRKLLLPTRLKNNLGFNLLRAE